MQPQLTHRPPFARMFFAGLRLRGPFAQVRPAEIWRPPPPHSLEFVVVTFGRSRVKSIRKLPSREDSIGSSLWAAGPSVNRPAQTTICRNRCALMKPKASSSCQAEHRKQRSGRKQRHCLLRARPLGETSKSEQLTRATGALSIKGKGGSACKIGRKQVTICRC